MYESIKEIRKLKEEKRKVLEHVYGSGSLDDVYKKQKDLGSMSISIFTDVANAIMPVLGEDGVSNVVWSKISLRLDKLSFISVPTASEIREKYKKSVDNPNVVKIDGDLPKPGTRDEVKKIPLPAFLLALASQGIAIPLIINAIGGTKLALVKVVLYAVNAACMVIEVVKYFDLFSKKTKKTTFTPSKAESLHTVNYEEMYKQTIQQVYGDNCKRLDDWFERLEKITREEIDKALREREG